MTVPTSDNEREPLLGTSSQTPARPVTARENLHKKAIKRFKQEIFIGQMRLMFWVAIQSLITGIINATTVSNTKTWATFMAANMVQLGLSLASFFLATSSPDRATREVSDALAALSGFTLGAAIAYTIDLFFKHDGRHRCALIIKALLRAIIFFADSYLISSLGWRESASWINVFSMAANMGVLAMSSHQLTPTVKDVEQSIFLAFLAILAQTFTSPFLPSSEIFGLSSRILEIPGLAVGAFISILSSRSLARSVISINEEMTILEAEKKATATVVAWTALLQGVQTFIWLMANDEKAEADEQVKREEEAVIRVEMLQRRAQLRADREGRSMRGDQEGSLQRQTRLTPSVIDVGLTGAAHDR